MRKFGLLLLMLLLLVLVPTSCAQKQKKKKAEKKGSDLPKYVTLLSLQGHNRDPHWIGPDLILYHSSQREKHSNYQIYRYKLGDSQDKRITFHDGDTDSAIYVPEEKALYYSSSTDEVKALSDLVERFQSEQASSFPVIAPSLTLFPTEIYRSNLEGGQIKRLTRKKGFDGRLGYNPDTKRILYSSLVGAHLQLHSIGSDGTTARQLTYSPVHAVNFNYSSRAGRYLWIQTPQDGPSQVWTANKYFKNRMDLELPKARYESARFAEGEDLLLSAHIEGVSKGFDLYLFSQEKSCLIPLLTAEGDQLTPDLSPDLKQIAFVHQIGSRSQIAIMPIEAPTASCLTLSE